MKFLRILAFWSLFGLQSVFAQPVSVTISVADKSNAFPLPGALVKTGERTGKATDAGGFAVFNINKNSVFKAEVSSLGFEVITLQFVVKRDTSVAVFLTQTNLVLEEVKVQAEKTSVSDQAFAKTTIEAHELHAHRGESLGEALRDVPGVELIAVGPGVSKPVIRGLHSNRIRILNNGVAQEGQQWGGEHAPEIDPFSAAKISVIKGAAGLEFGPGSIGGVVLVEPDEWDFSTPLKGKVDAGFFSNNRQGSGSVNLMGNAALFSRRNENNAKTKAYAWRLQSSIRYAGDAATPDYRITNSAFRENHTEAGLAFQNDEHFLDATASLFSTELGVYKGAHIGSTEDLINAINRGYPLVETGFSYNIDPPKQQVRHFVFSSRYKKQFSGGSNLAVKYGWQRNNRQEFDGHRRFSDVDKLSPAFELTLSTYTLDAVWNHKPLGDFVWKAGVSGVRQHNYREGAYLIPGYQLLGGGVFWVGSYATGKWGFEGGVRADAQAFHIYPVRSKNILDQDLKYGNLSAAFSTVYVTERIGSFGFTVGQSWRPPGINELFSDGVHHGTAQYETGNSSLGNEVSRSADITWKYETDDRHIEWSIFANHISGFIYSHPLGEPVLTVRGAFPSFEFRQTAAFLSGMEVLVEERVLPHTILSASGSWVRGQDLDQNRPLLFMPAPRIQSSVHQEFLVFKAAQTFVEARFTHVFHQSRFPEGIDYVDPPPAYQLLSLTAGLWKPFKNDQLRFTISVQNLLNNRYRDYQSRYRYFIDEPGRNILFRFSIPLT